MTHLLPQQSVLFYARSNYHWFLGYELCLTAKGTHVTFLQSMRCIVALCGSEGSNCMVYSFCWSQDYQWPGNEHANTKCTLAIKDAGNARKCKDVYEQDKMSVVNVLLLGRFSSVPSLPTFQALLMFALFCHVQIVYYSRLCQLDSRLLLHQQRRFRFRML